MDVISKLVQEIYEVGQQESCTFATAVITKVEPGEAQSGHARITVHWLGATVGVNGYLSSYTPVEGDVVMMARTRSTSVILGRVLGAF